MMIAALSLLYRVSDDEKYLRMAEKAESFIANKLCKDNKLYASFRDGRCGSLGFLDDYAFYVFALTALYEATFDYNYLEKAQIFCDRVIKDFYDHQNGGFTFSGKENEQLIFEAKENYDGAIPSGNSVMAYNLVKLSSLTENEQYGDLAEKQLVYISADAKHYLMGYSFYLLALSRYLDPPVHITAVLKNKEDLEDLKGQFGLDTDITVVIPPTEKYPLLNNETTFYVCRNHSCLPPTNEIPKNKNRLL
ncbi:hypothetical protein SDC9_130668 [bioreactor metagenome]|uniref:Thioredoxin domain-containing protein n=1 Tax=bioreactor metagenome TaxID=1076179 RepID=A0A645D317_9ZZZZ